MSIRFAIEETGGTLMYTEIALVAIAFATATLLVAAYKLRRKDVLYGPYIVPTFQQRWNSICAR